MWPMMFYEESNKGAPGNVFCLKVLNSPSMDGSDAQVMFEIVSAGP